MDNDDSIRRQLFQATTVARPYSRRKDRAMANASFWYCTPIVTNLVSALTRGQGAGDYDLSYLELIVQEGDEYETECTFRFAALHLHAARRSRVISIGKRKLRVMLELRHPHPSELVGSRYLARLEWLFGNPPASLEAYAFGVVEIAREKEEHMYEVRLTPVMLHLANPFSVMTIGETFKEEVLKEGMPIRQAPRKRHDCPQQAHTTHTKAGNA